MPPYFLVVELSACWKAAKIASRLSSGTPMPESRTEILRLGSEQEDFCAAASETLEPRPTTTSPRSVNLIALETRFFSICESLPRSLTIEGGSPSAASTRKPIFFFSARGENMALISRASSSGLTLSKQRSTLPASIFDRSRMSEMSARRSLPAALMLRA